MDLSLDMPGGGTGADLTMARGSVEVYVAFGTYQDQIKTALTMLREGLPDKYGVTVELIDGPFRSAVTNLHSWLLQALPPVYTVTINANTTPFEQAVRNAAAQAGNMGGAASAAQQAARPAGPPGGGVNFPGSAVARFGGGPVTPMAAGPGIGPNGGPNGGNPSVPMVWDRTPFINLGGNNSIGGGPQASLEGPFTVRARYVGPAGGPAGGPTGGPAGGPSGGPPPIGQNFQWGGRWGAAGNPGSSGPGGGGNNFNYNYSYRNFQPRPFTPPGMGAGFMSGIGLGGMMFGPQFFAGQMAGKATLGAIDAGADIEQQMVNVRRVSGMSAERSTQFLKEMQQIGREKPVRINDILDIAQTGARAGVSDPDQLAKFTKGASRVGLALAGSGLNEEKAVNGLLKIMEVFDAPPENIEKFGAAMVAVDNASKASTVELVNMTQRMAGIFKALGLNFQQTLGASAAMVDVGLRPEVGTSALARILMMMGSNMHEMAQNLGFDEKEMQKTYEEDPLKALGRVLETFKGAETNLEKLSFIQDGMGMGNIRDVNAFGNLAGSFEKVAQFADIATEQMTSQQALRDAEEMQSETFNAKMIELSNAFKELAVVLMSEFGPGLKAAIEFIASFTSGAAPVVNDTVSSIGVGYGAYKEVLSQSMNALFGADDSAPSEEMKALHDKNMKQDNVAQNEKLANMDEDERRMAILQEGRANMARMLNGLAFEQNQKQEAMLAAQGKVPQVKKFQDEKVEAFPQGPAIETEEEKEKREKKEKKDENARRRKEKAVALEQVAFDKDDLLQRKQGMQEDKWELSDMQQELRKAKNQNATMGDTASLGATTMMESLNSGNKSAEEQLADANHWLEVQNRELERQTEALNRIAFNTQHDPSFAPLQ